MKKYRLIAATACLVFFTAGFPQTGGSAAARPGRVTAVAPKLDSVPYLPGRIDSVLFIKFEVSSGKEDTVARIVDTAFFSRLTRGIASYRDTGELKNVLLQLIRRIWDLSFSVMGNPRSGSSLWRALQ
jgi:hypothetical protein